MNVREICSDQIHWIKIPILTTSRNTGTADYGLSQASQQQQQQHFNSTYAQNVGGGMPGGMMSFEPMAANEVIGSKF